MFQLEQWIDEPTRVPEHANSLIDIVLCNRPEFIVKSQG